MPAFAIYHQPAPAQSVKFVIVAENADGTVDLGREEKGEPVVTKCVVVDGIVHGSCSRCTDADEPAAKTSKKVKAE